MVKLAIAGGNIGGSALISLLREDPNTKIVGIYEKKKDAPGAMLAKKWDIPVFKDINSLITTNPEMIVNLTGDLNLSGEIRLSCANTIEVIEGTGARLLWGIIEKQKRTSIEALKILENQQIIFSLLSKLDSGEPIDTVMKLILEKALEITNAPSGSVVIFENGEMKLAASKGISKRFIDKKPWDIIPDGLTDAVITNKEIISINDTLKSNFTKNNPSLIRENIRALLAVPVVRKSKVCGILYIDDFKPRQFSDRQKTFLYFLAEFIGIASDRDVLVRNIEKQNLILSTLLKSSNDMVFLTDSYGLIRFVNESVIKALNYTREDLTDKPVKSLIKGNSWDMIQKELSKKSILNEYEVTVTGSGSTEIDVLLNAIVMRAPDKNLSSLILIMKDRVEGKEFEKSRADKTGVKLNDNLYPTPLDKEY